MTCIPQSAQSIRQRHVPGIRQTISNIPRIAQSIREYQVTTTWYSPNNSPPRVGPTDNRQKKKERKEREKKEIRKGNEKKKKESSVFKIQHFL